MESVFQLSYTSLTRDSSNHWRVTHHLHVLSPYLQRACKALAESTPSASASSLTNCGMLKESLLDSIKTEMSLH
jgi:hypothetical protein